MNKSIYTLLISLAAFPLLYCSVPSGSSALQTNTVENDSAVRGFTIKVNSRDTICLQLRQKIQQKKPLVVHVFVPLCDNQNQGIVPVNAQLGDGFNLKTNLYWGAGYGVKSYFKKFPEWKLISSAKDPSPDILERVIFKKKCANGAIVYLVADAYRGDRMKKCMHTYFKSLAGYYPQDIKIDSLNKVAAYSNADLLIFNGHDGLMDDTVKTYQSLDRKHRDAAVIACYSHHFFTPHFAHCGAYPLVMTTGLLAPEAYVMDAVITSWALMMKDLEIRYAAGDAYLAKHPKSGKGGARGLFKTGW